VPGLAGLVSPDYPPWDLSLPDNRRVDVWLKEFAELEANGKLPALSIVRLGNDHTAGTRPGYPTPTAMIAENDLALGRVVEAISKSRYWKESAVFVLEDDAQNGPDHVDAHRTLAQVISPYTRTGAVDSTLYSTAAMLRTIEDLVGLSPLTQFDAQATSMLGSFGDTADLTPYAAVRPAMAGDARNAASAPMAAVSARQRLDREDQIDERTFNEAIWQSVKGRGSRMPAPRGSSTAE